MEGFQGWNIFSLLFFLTLAGRVVSKSSVSRIWKIKAQPIVVVFGWIALHKRILTMDNLRQRGKIVVNCCPMCLGDEESVDHLLEIGG